MYGGNVDVLRVAHSVLWRKANDLMILGESNSEMGAHTTVAEDFLAVLTLGCDLEDTFHCSKTHSVTSSIAVGDKK